MRIGKMYAIENLNFYTLRAEEQHANLRGRGARAA